MSSSPFQSEALLTVGRWTGIYHVPRDCSVPQEVQRRVDGIVSGQLAAAFSSYLESCLNGADPAVWRIRNLTVNFSLEAEFSDPFAVARDWGRSLASEVISLLDRGESDSILRFPNRTAFLAQFLADLAAGRAWGKWYYEEFLDLQVLSSRQAICAIFLRRDTPPVELLLQLTSLGRLESVLQTLNDTDARTIFDLCFENASGGPSDNGLQKWTGIVLALWNTAPLRTGSRHENRFRDALRLLARTLSRFPAGQGDIQLKAVVYGLLELRRVLSEILSPVLMDSLIQALARADLSAAAELAARAGVPDPVQALSFFSERMQGDAAWGAQTVAVILGESYKEKFLNAGTFSEGESFLSFFGGIFLLGPSFEALQFTELVRAAANPSESPEKSAAILRHLMAIKCLGRSRFTDTSDDPALRLFSGFEGTSFRQALENTVDGQHDMAAAHGVLLQSLLDRKASHPPVFFAELLSSPPGNVVFLLRDLSGDEWLDLVPVSSDRSDVAAVAHSSLRRISAAFNVVRPALFIGDSLSSLEDASSLYRILDSVAEPHLLNDPKHEQLAAQLGLTRQQLAFRLDSAQHHYPHFSLASISSDFELAPSTDCMCTLFSRAALRHFARKLFGFESSSPEHLNHNFLLGLSEIRLVGQHLEVCLPASPLSLILRMAGLQEQKFVPSWLKGLEVWLLPPQE